MRKHSFGVCVRSALLLALAASCLAQTATYTSFPSTAVGATSAPVNLNFTGSCGSYSLYTGSDFNVGSGVSAGGNCSVPVTFKPTASGLRQGLITANQNNTTSYVYVYGIGIGPQISVSPGVISSVANQTSISSLVPGGIAVGNAGVIYVSDTHGNAFYNVVTNSGQAFKFQPTGPNGLALNGPTALVIDGGGNLYIINSGSEQVVKFTNNSLSLVSIPGLATPAGLAIDALGNLYVSDKSGKKIFKVDASGNVSTPVSSLNSPAGLAVDASGNLFIADSGDNVIYEWTGSSLNRVAGQVGAQGYTGDGGSATTAQLNAPAGVFVDAGGSIYITDKGNNVIRKVTGDASHTISTLVGNGHSGYTGDGGAANQAALSAPAAIALDSTGNLFFVDSANNVVRQITALPASLPEASTTLTVSNTGNADLSLSGIVPFGSFQSSGGTCSTASVVPAGGSCTISLNFIQSNAPSGGLTITSNSETNASISIALSGLRFVPVTPCRIADTRNATGAFGGPEIAGGSSRTFNIPSSACSIPSTAAAYSLNVTVVPDVGLGYLTVWPTGESQPYVSTLNSVDGRVNANAAIVPAGSSGSINVFASNSTQVILDINGYFVPASSSTQAFYSLTPCRVADTRNPTGSLGGPYLSGGVSRDFPILSSSCSIPAGATAYSLNFTTVPHGGLGYITVWPTGGAQPLVSTLNAVTGKVTANAAIVPAGSNGKISVFASNDTDLVVDLNGYFAPPNTGGLSLYTVAPCRVIDTRNAAGQFTGTLPVNVTGGSCVGAASNAQSFVTNATVVPSGALQYLTLWPNGGTQPYVSTLNSTDGVVTANMAIVPTTNGSINAFATNPTQLVLDISAYFAP